METREKIFNILTLGPIILAPFLAVQFPRALAYLPIISAVFGGLYLYFGLHQRPSIPKPVIIFFGGLISLAGLSLTWATFFDDASERVIKLASLLPFYALFLGVCYAGRSYFTPKFTLYLLISCALGACFVTLDLLLDSAIYLSLHEVEDMSEYSTAVFNRGALSILLIGMAALMLHQGGTLKLSALIILPMLAMLFLIQSQATQLAALLAVLFYFLFPASRAWAWCLMFAGIALSMLAKPFIVGVVADMLPSSVGEVSIIRDAYVAQRLEVWQFVSDQIMTHLWLGQGLEVISNIPHQFTSFDKDGILHPHSAILQIWVELGVLGISLAVFCVAWLLRYMFANLDRHHAKAAITTFVILFTVANITYGIWQGWWLGLFCIIAGMYIIIAREKQYLAAA